MTFGPNHYVPVLKTKKAEKEALKLLDPALVRNLTPLLEIHERREDGGSTLAGHLDTVFAGLAESLRPYGRSFLDVREIGPDGPAGAEQAFERAAAEGIAFTPVTGISRTVDVDAALAHRDFGLAIRLTRDEFEQGMLASTLLKFMRKHGLEAEATDLILDLGAVDDMIPEGITAFGRGFVLEVPDPVGWRTLTLSGSAFPESMSVVERRSHNLVERAEWLAWRTLVAGPTDLPRTPTYSDCGIQHPSGVEGIDFRLIPMSAAIRYTLTEQWLLIKGVSNRQEPMGEQFQQLATKLFYGHLKDFFAGESHCAGCAAVRRAAHGKVGLGSLGAWRRVGTVHHITMVVQQLQSVHGA